MKLAIILAATLFSVNIFACESLVGTWHCKDNFDNTETKDTYRKIENGYAVVSLQEGATVSELIADGKEHKTEMDGSKLTYRAVLLCEGSEGTYSMSYSATGADDQGNAILSEGTSNGKLSIRGGQMVQSTVDTNKVTLDGEVVDESASESSIVCSKL